MPPYATIPENLKGDCRMSRFGKRVVRNMMKRVVRRALKRRAMKRMVKRGRHVKSINHARPKVGGTMLT